MRDGTTYPGDMPWPVRGVDANDDYTLTVTFASGETKLFDFTPYLEIPFYSRPRNKGYFRRARAGVRHGRVGRRGRLSRDPLRALSAGVAGGSGDRRRFSYSSAPGGAALPGEALSS